MSLYVLYPFFYTISPYGNQGLLLTAQIFMGLTLLISTIGWWFTWICGLIAWILIMLLACTKVNHFIVILSGVLASWAALGQFLMAGYSKRVNIYCSAIHNQTLYTDDYFNGVHHHHLVNVSMTDDQTFTTACHDFLDALIVLGIITGIGWTIAALLAFLVSCHLKQKEDGTLSAWETQNRIHKLPTNNDAPSSGNVTNTTETTQQMPDGSTKITQIMTHADGSQTVTERIETPIVSPNTILTGATHDNMPVVVMGVDVEEGNKW